MDGINANHDSTASSHGVPQGNRLPVREEQAESTVYSDPDRTDVLSTTEGRSDDKMGSHTDSWGKEDQDSVEAEMVRRSSVVQALARSYSRTSTAAVPGQNPFCAEEDSPLNPNSPNFSAREWAKAVVELVSQDGKEFRSAGVCYQHLNVHGYGVPTDYQKDVANIWLSAASSLLGSGKQRIEILRNLDGLVRKGEMLVVLGPPGSGCSTFLKTIAGEMNGIYAGDGSYFNYQGKPKTYQPSFFISSVLANRGCRQVTGGLPDVAAFQSVMGENRVWNIGSGTPLKHSCRYICLERSIMD